MLTGLARYLPVFWIEMKTSRAEAFSRGEIKALEMPQGARKRWWSVDLRE